MSGTTHPSPEASRLRGMDFSAATLSVADDVNAILDDICSTLTHDWRAFCRAKL